MVMITVMGMKVPPTWKQIFEIVTSTIGWKNSPLSSTSVLVENLPHMTYQNCNALEEVLVIHGTTAYWKRRHQLNNGVRYGCLLALKDCFAKLVQGWHWWW
jgi:hypothetical protein